MLRNMAKTMSDSLTEEVQGSFTAYKSLWESRAEALSSVSRVSAGWVERPIDMH